MRMVNCSILDYGTIWMKLIFSLQLSSRTQFAKIGNKKLSPKINVKNIKTSFYFVFFSKVSDQTARMRRLI